MFTCLPPWQGKNCNTAANTAQAFLDYVTLVLEAKNRTTTVTNLKKEDLLPLRKLKKTIITSCSKESEWVNMDL